ncbi:MAG: sigma-70 family RNA polymerase sigma factor [Polyangia bacterium]|jgi:RNA polymerase sigma factor (sigma-70 family)|nr:sigma-70 family RNA polymerase sigma factor [Polyangia bacterium]
MSAAENEFLPVLVEHLRGVHGFCYRVTNSSEKADEAAREVFLRAYAGRAKLPDPPSVLPWLIKIAVHVLGRFDSSERLTFEFLDETIRGDPTQVTRTGALSDPERQGLLWELRQGCMTAVLACLSEGERMAFVLVVMMKMRTSVAAAALGITQAALKVRLSRSRKKIVDYLAPRCEHVHPQNPCRCPSRLGVALRKGFISELPRGEISLRKAALPGPMPVSPLRDVVSIYETLPPPTGGDELLERLEGELLSGTWDRLIAP